MALSMPPLVVIFGFRCVSVSVVRAAAWVARHVKVLSMRLVEAIRLELQGHHMEAVVVGQAVVGGLQNPGGIGWIGMSQVC